MRPLNLTEHLVERNIEFLVGSLAYLGRGPTRCFSAGSHSFYGARGRIGVMEQDPEWATGLPGFIFYIVVLALLTCLLMWIYRTMQRPRLYISYRPDTKEPYFAVLSIVRYLALLPFALAVWYFPILLIIMFAAADDRDAETVAVAAAVVVGTARLLAHVSPEASHELGKTIPLSAVTLVLIGGTASGEGVQRLSEALELNSGNLDTLYWTLLVFDVIITAVWSWRQHSKWVAHQPGTNRNRILRRAQAIHASWKSLRDFGKPEEAKSQ